MRTKEAARPPIMDLVERPIIRIPSSAATAEGFQAWIESEQRPRGVRLSFLDDAIRLVIPRVMHLDLPTSALTLDGFCDWADSPQWPDRGRFSFLDQEVFIDVSPESIESHTKVKDAVNRCISVLVADLDLGEYLPDGAMILNKRGKVANEPDAAFIRYETTEAGRVVFTSRSEDGEGDTIIEGTPDWVVEIVSPSSVSKDTRRLRRNYLRAGIPEYWLIDARGDDIDFQILVRQPRRYVQVPADQGLAALSGVRP